jgi:hypothetical protein
LEEVFQVLRVMFLDPKRVFILKRDDGLWAVYAGKKGTHAAKPVFSHGSFAACVEFALKYQPEGELDASAAHVDNSAHIRYDVISGPSPEFLEGKPGRAGIYAVVKLVNDYAPELVKVFDGPDSSQSRWDAYAYARKLDNEHRVSIGKDPWNG